MIRLTPWQGCARSLAALAVLICCALLATPAFASKRIALVVGNNSYSSLPADRQLRNAVNDARLMRETLQGLGFEVLYGENLDRRDLIDRLFDLTARLGPEDIAFFFFAGHGVSFSGANYLLPSDIPAPRATGRAEEGRLAEQALAESVVIERLTASGARVSIVVLDACRDNPLQGGDRRAVGTARGLAQSHPARGVFSIYSAGFGQTALDRLGPDDASPNSVFTRVFAEKLRSSGLDLRSIATQTRSAVVGLTQKIGHDQFPAYYDQIIGDDIVFAARTDSKTAGGDSGAKSEDPARVLWSTIQNTSSVAILEDFIRQHGATLFGSLAKARLEEVRKEANKQSAAVAPSPTPDAKPAAPPTPVVKLDAKAARDLVARNFAAFNDIIVRTKSDYVERPDEARMMRGAIDALRRAYPQEQTVAAAGPIPARTRSDAVQPQSVLAAASEILVAGAPAEAQERLFSIAVNGMLTELDPHSAYMDANAFRDMQIQTRGEFGGLGLEVTAEDGLVKVVAPIDDTPAAKAGIQANDVITHIDDVSVQGLSLNQAVEKMRGPLRTQVKLRVTRKGQERPLELTITRDTIRVRAVRSRPEGDDIAYIRITQFNEQTTENLKAAIADLAGRIQANKLKGFIIDLRNNPGGLLDQAISVSDSFLERGEIVSTRARTSVDNQRFSARSGDLTKGKPIIVLINGGSASASEILAGALQDHKRGTVLGTRSFGKGSVQTIIPLAAGQGALRLTTARYYTPSGKSIQAKGISPDIEVLQDVPDELKEKADLKGESALRHHLKGDGAEQDGSQSYIPPDAKDDKALKMAAELLRGSVTNPAFQPAGRRPGAQR